MSQKEPTNKELMNEIKSLHGALKGLDERLVPLERWKIAFDAADAAIIKYKQEHGEISSTLAEKKVALADGINKDFVSVVLKFLGVISVLLSIVYLIIQAVIDKV